MLLFSVSHLGIQLHEVFEKGLYFWPMDFFSRGKLSLVGTSAKTSLVSLNVSFECFVKIY